MRRPSSIVTVTAISLSVAAATISAQSAPPSDSAPRRDLPARPADSVTASRTVAQLATGGDSATATPVTPTPAVNYLQTALSGVRISGYAEASYVHSNNANGSAVAGRLYDRFQNQFTVNALKLVLDHAYAPDKWDAGFHTDILFGQNATMLQSNGLSLGNQGDITQLYVTLNVPTPDGNGVQFRVGKMATLMGLEVIEDPSNPNWSEGNLFNFVENFTEVGLSVEHKFNAHVDAQLRYINGWDVVQDNNKGNSFMGRVGLYPDSLSSIGVVGYYGPEQATTWAERWGAELLLGRRLSSSVGAWLQGDYGHEAALVPPADGAGASSAASWWGASAWLTVDFDATLGLTLRADYVDDERGVRSNGFLFPAFSSEPGMRHTFSSGTLTLNVKRWQNVLLRPEIRYDDSNLPLFNGHDSQVTLALAVAYLY